MPVDGKCFHVLFFDSCKENRFLKQIVTVPTFVAGEESYLYLQPLPHGDHIFYKTDLFIGLNGRIILMVNIQPQFSHSL